MRRIAVAAVFAVLAVLPAGACAQEEPPAPLAVGELPVPALGGDRPDPDITEVGGTYYAIATSGGWAPAFPILASTDLASWETVGAVFPRTPRWTRDAFWAPEMTALPSGGYAVYYSAWPRRARGGRYCLGVATAPEPTGPWRDRGRPLRCTRAGAIDPTPVVDGDDLWLAYKIDGNSLDRRTPILIQRLSADGRRLTGRPRELIRNRAKWERLVVEAPEIVQRDGWWHMIYSAALCCGPRCDYAVGAARAEQLIGPWRKYPGNPILRGGRGWNCPGHVSLMDDRVAFHAYRDGDLLAGRQLLFAPLTFGADGWPAIGDGQPAAPRPGAASIDFDDVFGEGGSDGTPEGDGGDDAPEGDGSPPRTSGPGAGLAPEWEWPVTHPVRTRVGDDGLLLRAPVRSKAPGFGRRELARRLDAGMLSRRVATSRFAATATVELASLRGRAVAGLAITRGGPFGIGGQSIGVAVGRPDGRGRAEVTVWRRKDRRYREWARTVRLTGSTAHLRLLSTGRRVRFQVSDDGARWRPAGRRRSTPVVETGRIALTVGGRRAAAARFERATLTHR